MVKRMKEDVKMDVDDTKNEEASRPAEPNSFHALQPTSVASSVARPEEYPASFTMTLQLTFAMFHHVLCNLFKKALPFSSLSLLQAASKRRCFIY
jgi:hypothetical protein